MSLRITKAIEPITVDRITTCIYAVPGLGRTTLGYSADKPLLFDFDDASHRAKNRKDTVRVTKWSEVCDIKAEDLEPFKTVVIDTAGRALDMLATHIIDSDPKMGRGGALTIQGYGRLKADFLGWLRLVRSFGHDIVMLCHSDEQRKGDELIERLDVQGGSKNEIYKQSDVMGRLYMASGKRWLSFSPTDTAFGKNPAALDTIEVPHWSKQDGFLGGIIATTKAKLNELSDLQTQAAAAQVAWKASLDAAKTADDFTALIAPAKDVFEPIRDACKRMLVASAKVAGFALDKDHGKFAPIEVAPESPNDSGTAPSGNVTPTSSPNSSSTLPSSTTATSSRKAK
jgi:hypothetical protein